jgi:hypothetical protein
MRIAAAQAILGTLLAAGMAVAYADSPARLREGPDSIESKLHVPKGLEPGRYDVHCELRVLANGTPRKVACYSLDASAPQPLMRAVQRATRRAKFTPATRNGEPVQIYMVLMVRTVIADGSEPLVLVLPNNGVEHARLGLFYIAPQRFNVFHWDYPLPRTVSFKSRGELIWQELWIDELGNIKDAKLVNSSNAPPDMVEYLRHSVDTMQFMPGWVDGKPVAMRYLEPAWSHP